MPGMFARLYRLFKTDVSIDPDGPIVNKSNVPFIGDGSGGTEMWDAYQKYLNVDAGRMNLYRIYDQMDTFDLISGILDMHAEDATPIDPRMEKTIWITSSDKDIEKFCNEFLDDIGYEEDITALARDIAKWGDAFDRLVYSGGYGIRATHFVHPRLVHRKENKIRQLQGFTQDGKKFRRGTSTLSYPWDYVHYRLRGRNRESQYGSSILFPLIRVQKQLAMAEDYSLLYQISRHPDRYLFQIDVGTKDEADAQRTVRQFKNSVKQHIYKDPKSGSFDHRMNPLTPLEDIFLGVREGSNTKLEKLSGSTNANDIANLMYYVNKLFATARVPKTLFGYEGTSDVYNPKQAVANQDIRYAKNIQRLQRAIKHGVRTLLEIHLVIQGKKVIVEEKENVYRKGGQYEFDVNMAPVSYLEELQRLELDQTRWQVVDSMMQSGRDHTAFDSRAWVYYILSNYARLAPSALNKVLVPLQKARDREGYWYGGTGEMPSDQRQAMTAQNAAQIAQSQQMIQQAEQGEGEEREPTAEEMAQMSDSELKQLGLSDKDIAQVRKLTKEESSEFDPDRISADDRSYIHEMVKHDPRVRDFIAKAQSLYGDDAHSYRPIPLPSDKHLNESDGNLFKDDLDDSDFVDNDEE